MMTKSMEFFRAIYKKEIVFFIYKEVLDDSLLRKILSSAALNKKVGLDMKNVKVIESELFFDCLREDKFKLFNLNSEILAYLSIIFKSGFLKTFMNYKDFSNNKRELFKRNLKIV